MTTGMARAVQLRLETLRTRHAVPGGINLGLERVEALLAELDHPERRGGKVVHVAGTNGKGSTLAFLHHLLAGAGHSTNLYTSPHLIRFNERIAIDGVPIDDGTLVSVLDRVLENPAADTATFFEATTAAAFLCFAKRPADFLLLETGLGGRLDATNVIPKPAAVGITPVGLDHTAFLGTTIGAIAAEKAGILRPGVPAIIGAQPPAALAVILDACATVGAQPLLRDRDWWVETKDDGTAVLFTNWGQPRRIPVLPLAGSHQIDNAAMAVVLADTALGRILSEDAIAIALSATAWPGRLQRLTEGRLVDAHRALDSIWVDAAHNIDGARRLAAFLRHTGMMPTALAVGMYRDKDLDGFLAAFIDCGIERVIAMTADGEQPARPVAEIIDAAHRLGLPAAAAPDPAGLVLAATGPCKRLVISGSIALIGQVLALNAGECHAGTAA